MGTEKGLNLDLDEPVYHLERILAGLEFTGQACAIYPHSDGLGGLSSLLDLISEEARRVIDKEITPILEPDTHEIASGLKILRDVLGSGLQFLAAACDEYPMTNGIKGLGVVLEAAAANGRRIVAEKVRAHIKCEAQIIEERNAKAGTPIAAS